MAETEATSDSSTSDEAVESEERYSPIAVIGAVAERLGYRTPSPSRKVIEPISLLLGYTVGRNVELLDPKNQGRLEFVVEQTLGAQARRRRAEAHERAGE